MARDVKDDTARVARAKALLGVDPRTAADLARTLSVSVEAHFLLAAALRRCGEVDEALTLIEPLAAAHPRVWGFHYEHGMMLAIQGRVAAAIPALERATLANPQSSLAWHALGDQYLLLGRTVDAQAAQSRLLPGSIGDAAFVATVLASFDVPDGDALRTRFGIDLNDPAALRLLADVTARNGRDAAAEAMLARAIAAAPCYGPAGFHKAILLLRQDRGAEALTTLEPLSAFHETWPATRALRASILMLLGREQEAAEDFAAAVAASPDDARLHHGHGHALRSIGRQDDAVAAYRRAIAIEPTFGEAYWSLANLKTWHFDAADVGQMRSLVARPDLRPEDRSYLHFALGKALEDVADYPNAFAHYRDANAARRATDPWDADAHSDYVRRCIALFDARFFAERAGAGNDAPDPIFVLGMPRSGSTLIEQILASHSQVEGLSELPDITNLAWRVGAEVGSYPDGLTRLPVEAFAALGTEYLERTHIRRASDRPLFVDKFPGNFLHIGLIQLMLPRARIIDVRRGALACGMSLFKQSFAGGQSYSYDLRDLGRYFADYDALMQHFDAVLPGRVLHISYEALVDAPEREVRRLLDHVGLAFEPACLTFFRSKRAVRTPSSEQVRRPIFREGLDQWRHFEPWLGPLKAALAPLASAVPDRP